MSTFQSSSGADYAPTAQAEKVVEPGEFAFAAALLYGASQGLQRF